MNSRMCKGKREAFTLIELLVVIAIIGLLVGILVPSLARAQQLARQVTCLTRVHAQMRAIHMYATEADGAIPIGPPEPMELPGGYMGPPLNQIASNQIWIGHTVRSYNAHGVLLEKYLTQPVAMFCPDDDSSDPVEELAKLRDRGDEDAYCSYLYRQLDGRRDGPTPRGRLEDLGENNAGATVTALVMDMNSLMQIPGACIRTNHRAEKVNIGFAAGHADTFDNRDQNLTLRAEDVMNPFSRLDSILEYADTLGQ